VPGVTRIKRRILIGLLALPILIPVSALAATETTGSESHLLMVVPFALLLLSIAILPLTHKLWWEKQYPWVAGVLGAIVILYYLVIRQDSARVGHAFIEYFSFISLLTALFVISGGIHIRVAGQSTPVANTVILAIGALLASLIGTTGASMLLIRPYLRMNKSRARPYHIVFFIFTVSNIGGGLTPIGDPPLFLGYLKGVPFFWVMEKVWLLWVLTMVVVLALFFAFDWWSFRQLKEKPKRTTEDRIVMEGSHNFLFLFLILAAVLAQGTELLASMPHALVTGVVAVFMLGVSVAAYRTTPATLRAENEFDFHPIIEVAIIFAGLFATMAPALDYVAANAIRLGLDSVDHYFWYTGILSAVLDNAPTYLNFLAAAFGLHSLDMQNPGDMARLLKVGAHYVVAISVAAVFFGAMTYIGNGPNFMVRSIAEAAGVRCPSFFGYFFKYALPILFPLFFVIYWVFFRTT
jgi:Na+/H+ antiporter NhaD/arsenite permease-like protein